MVARQSWLQSCGGGDSEAGPAGRKRGLRPGLRVEPAAVDVGRAARASAGRAMRRLEAASDLSAITNTRRQQKPPRCSAQTALSLLGWTKRQGRALAPLAGPWNRAAGAGLHGLGNRAPEGRRRGRACGGARFQDRGSKAGHRRFRV